MMLEFSHLCVSRARLGDRLDECRIGGFLLIAYSVQNCGMEQRMGQSAGQPLRYLRANASSAQQATTALPETNILSRNNATKLNPSTSRLHSDQTNKEYWGAR